MDDKDICIEGFHAISKDQKKIKKKLASLSMSMILCLLHVLLSLKRMG